MCSISGIIEGTEKEISSMIEIQKHRAPDDSNYYLDSNIALGMGRLKIIDLYSDNLCLREEDNLVLSFNGEIYNYLEIKDKLKLKYNFKTNSDTEVLIKSWKEYGVKALSLFNGMFAFAIYDKKKQKLYLARDIAGEKPMYYYHDSKNFIFSSEAKAIQTVKKLKYKMQEFYINFQHCLGDTLYENLYELPAAHYLEYCIKTKKIKIVEYWQFKKRKINLKTADEELEFLLKDSINLRLRSDTKVGIYLSDGLDSNLLASFYNFDHKFYFDDKKNWKGDFFKNIHKIAYHLDFPVGSLSSYPLWKLAEQASKKVKVVISGEGADEIFGGYVRYLPISLQWQLEKEFPSYKFFFSKNYESYLSSYSKITSRNKQEGVPFVYHKIKKYFEMFDDPISAMGFTDFKIIMPSLLQMGDRMSSAFGIENRCPYLDKRIIEFGFSLPWNSKILFLEQKIMLRKLANKRKVLKKISLEKKGLTIRFNSWFKRKDWDRSYYFKLLNKKWKENLNFKFI
jgi:asparagine synthase (glutamine-hydrolysing)